MTKRGSQASSGSNAERFARIYNDLETYPTLESVAKALNRSVKTVRNYAAILRARREEGRDVPELIPPRSTVDERNTPESLAHLPPREHAERRASGLQSEVRALLTRSDYPVVNPEALVIKHHVTERYDRVTGRRTETEGTPRTWLSDTLRVAVRPAQRNRVMIFSGAQNDAPIHERFWANLNAYADVRDAEIVIGPWTYETSWWNENNPASRTYHEALEAHLCFGQMQIGEDFMFCGEMNTLPTASKPISDLTAYAKGRWAVFPHSKIQLISVPSTNPLEQAHQALTTGAVTLPMVSPRKAGVKSLSEHRIGALIVEWDEEGDFFCRQLIADERGDFQDLDTRVENGVVSFGHRIDLLTPGDIHSAKLGDRNCGAVFGFDMAGNEVSGSMLEMLRPRHITLHDLHDHESRNHHNAKDVSHNFEMAHRGRESILGELHRSAAFLERLVHPDLKVIVVESNHDLALERYIREGRYRMDGVNFRFGLDLDAAYHDWRAEVAEALERGDEPPEFSLLEHALREVSGETIAAVEWVCDSRSRVINGVEVGNHGFRGANGAKGTVTGFAKLGQPMTIADKHSPAIMNQLYVAGVMELSHGYNKGLSSWAVSHVVQYDNGNRAMITMQKGKWRAET